MKRTAYLVVWLLSLTLPLAWGQDAALYEYRVLVPDDSEDSLNSGLRQALVGVLVKVTGDSAVGNSPGVAAAVKKARDNASRYGFQQEIDASGESQLYLWASFAPDAVASLLAEQGLRQWQGRRPRTLVWVISQESGGRFIEGAEGDSAVIDTLRDAAGRRGIEIVVPLHDLEDQRTLTASDLWGNFADVIRAASARYPAGVVLVGRLQPLAGGGWSGRWTVYQGDEHHDWEGTAGSREELAAAAITVHADRLASVYGSGAAATAEPEQLAGTAGAAELRLHLQGLGGFGRYLRVSAYLGGLGVVAAIDPVMVAGDRAEFLLRLNGSVGGLERVLALEQVLVPLPDAGPAVAGRLPVYELVR